MKQVLQLGLCGFVGCGLTTSAFAMPRGIQSHSVAPNRLVQSSAPTPVFNELSAESTPYFSRARSEPIAIPQSSSENRKALNPTFRSAARVETSNGIAKEEKEQEEFERNQIASYLLEDDGIFFLESEQDAAKDDDIVISSTRNVDNIDSSPLVSSIEPDLLKELNPSDCYLVPPNPGKVIKSLLKDLDQIENERTEQLTSNALSRLVQNSAPMQAPKKMTNKVKALKVDDVFSFLRDSDSF